MYSQKLSETSVFPRKLSVPELVSRGYTNRHSAELWDGAQANNEAPEQDHHRSRGDVDDQALLVDQSNCAGGYASMGRSSAQGFG